MRGGKRVGAGRPEGSKNEKNARATIYTYFKEADIEEFFEFLKDNYKEDMRLMQWVGDHILGRAPQSIDHTTLGEKMPTPIYGGLSIQGHDSSEEAVSSKKEN